MINYMRKKGRSATILVLAAGEKEIVQITTQWSASSAGRKFGECQTYRVDSNTSKSEREKIRTQLKEQHSSRKICHHIVVATEIFGRSITLHINGLIDTGLIVDLNINTFLQVRACNEAESVQRRGMISAEIRVNENIDSLFANRDLDDVLSSFLPEFRF